MSALTDIQVEQLINEVQKRPAVWNKWSPMYKNRLAVDQGWQAIAEILKENKDQLKMKWKNMRDVFQKEFKKMKIPRSGDPGSPQLENYTGRWCYFEKLFFLKDTIHPRATDGNYPAGFQNNSESQKFDETVVDSLQSAGHCDQSVQEIQFSQENQQLTQETYEPAHVTADSEQQSQQSQEYLNADTNAQTPPMRPSSRTSTTSTQKKRKRESDITPFEKAMLSIEEKKVSALAADVTENDPDMLYLKSLHPFFRGLGPLQKLQVCRKIENILEDAISANNPVLPVAPPPHTPPPQTTESYSCRTYMHL